MGMRVCKVATEAGPTVSAELHERPGDVLAGGEVADLGADGEHDTRQFVADHGVEGYAELEVR